MTGAGATGPIRLAPEDIRPTPPLRATQDLAELVRVEHQRTSDVGQGIRARFFQEAGPDLTDGAQGCETLDSRLVLRGDDLASAPNDMGPDQTQAPVRDAALVWDKVSAGPQALPSVLDRLARVNEAGPARTEVVDTPGPRWRTLWRIDQGANRQMAVN
jgi:hypothetical protein